MIARMVFWQYNIALVRSSDGVRSAAPFQALFASERELGGQLGCWFFTRKRPDLRLRVEASRNFHAELEQRLHACARSGEICSVARATYEPQVGMFGGPWGLALAHAQFRLDSEAWWRLSELETADHWIDWPNVSCSLLNELFCGVLESIDEVWEVWLKLRALRPDGVASIDRPLTVERALLGHAPELATALEPLLEGNRELASELAQLHLAGCLTCGERALLANLAQFHLNRWGIRQASEVIASMVHQLDPNVDRATHHPEEAACVFP
ncbi:MAG: thiopeptide-type bacteriocin biosynthesis protein [Myxococcales bacterium]|nr:thiopeptide-type bacteriocin biosynthesis protein [Myxococcales bacterium]